MTLKGPTHNHIPRKGKANGKASLPPADFQAKGIRPVHKAIRPGKRRNRYPWGAIRPKRISVNGPKRSLRRNVLKAKAKNKSHPKGWFFVLSGEFSFFRKPILWHFCARSRNNFLANRGNGQNRQNGHLGQIGHSGQRGCAGGYSMTASPVNDLKCDLRHTRKSGFLVDRLINGRVYFMLSERTRRENRKVRPDASTLKIEQCSETQNTQLP